MAREPLPSVGALFNAVHKSAAAGERCAKHLWRLLQKQEAGTLEQLLACVTHLLVTGEKAAPLERCVRFLGTLAAHVPPQDEGCSAALEVLVAHLADQLQALDKVVRFRACQTLALLLECLPKAEGVSEELARRLADGLLERLQDKAPLVRAQAARALARLPVADEQGSYQDDPVVIAFQELLLTEKSKDVRIAVVQSLPLADDTLPLLLERLRDVNALVRKTVLLRFKDVSVQLLSIKQRALLLKDGLNDRDTTVQEAALKVLLRWYETDCGKDARQLLELLDVETYADEAILGMHTLIAAEAFDAVHFAKAASTAGASLQDIASNTQLLDAATALLWRCICVWLHGDAVAKGLAAACTTGAAAAVGAANAADRHEVLEAVLPQSAEDIMALIMRHAANGPQHRFAAMQLLHVAAACMDWTDAASRQTVTPALARLICADPRAEEHEDEGVPLQGNGGDGAFERALCDLVMAVNSSTQQYASAMLEALGAVAASWGLLSEDSAGSSGTAHAAQPCLWLQCLSYAALLLQRCSGRQRFPWHTDAGFSFAALWDSLCLRALRHSHAAVRARAVEVMALYALVPGADAGGAPVVLCTTVLVLSTLLTADTLPVQASAARALCDLALLVGTQRLDALLCAPVEAGSAHTVAEALAAATGGVDGIAAAEDCDSVSAMGRGVVGLLLKRLTVLLAGGSSARTARRASSRSAGTAAAALSGDAAELLSVIGEGLAKLVTAQVVGLPQGSALPDQQRNAVLAKLLLLQFHPVSERCTKLRQCLSVFFEVYAGLAQADRAALAEALFPAARAAMAVPVVKKAPAPLLVKYVLQLLCAAGGHASKDASKTTGHQRDKEEEEEDAGAAAGEPQTGAHGRAAALENAALAMQLVQEAVRAMCWISMGAQSTRYRPYAAALVKAVLALPYAPAHVRELQELQAFTAHLAGLVPDGPLRRDVAAVQEQLRSMEAMYPAGQPLSAAEREGVIHRFKANVLDFAPEGVAATGAAGSESNRGTATKHKAPILAARRVPGSAARRGRTANRIEDSVSDAESDQVLQRPPPRAAAPVYAEATSTEGSSDSGSDSADHEDEERPALARQPLAPTSSINTAVGSARSTHSASKADASLAGHHSGLRLES